jgi:hypothetical protein
MVPGKGIGTYDYRMEEYIIMALSALPIFVNFRTVCQEKKQRTLL